MKKSELQKAIREMIITEMNGDDYEKMSREVEYGVNPYEIDPEELEDNGEEFSLSKNSEFKNKEDYQNYHKLRFWDETVDDLEEAKDKKEKTDTEQPEETDTEEIDITEPLPDETGTDETGSGDNISGDEKEIQDSLEKALDLARNLGDEKLIDQIGNTITFFTRSHVVKTQEGLQEVKRFKKLAGLI